MRTSRIRLAGLGIVAALSLTAAACSSGTKSASSNPTPAAPTTMAAPSPASGLSTTNFGPGCAAVPTDGKGSFSGMAQDPAATAASNNPALSTLVAAVKAAGLVDTLNGTGPFTVFAPTNDAFAKIDKAGDTITVNGQTAVVCGNVQTANATVQIIDTVLMPG